MRAGPPVTRAEGQRLVVRTALTSADGTELPPLEVGLPRAWADLLDPTALPLLPVLATVAAARGEDLRLDAPADARSVERAGALAARLAERWGTGPVRVDAGADQPAAGGGDGCALLFTRGVDSWSTLLDLGDQVTHLVTVLHGAGLEGRPPHAALLDGHRAVAADLGLPLLVLTTTARTLLDPLQPWAQVVGPTLVGAALVAGAGLGRVVFSGVNRYDVPLASGSDPALVPLLSTPTVEVVLGNPHRDRLERIAHVAGHERARRTLQVCWEGETEGNCGRCNKCLSTAAGLVLAGDPDPVRGFAEDPLDPEVVRRVRLTAADSSGLTARLAAELPPEHEELRRAWADARDASAGAPPRARWGDDAPPGLAGPGVPARVARALRAATGQAEAPAPRPLGWRPGAVPLRPALADHAAARAHLAGTADRPRAWAVVEHHVRAGRRDGAQAGLALRAQAALGPGTCYLPGLLWGPTAEPVLDAGAVARLLGGVRARLWWREDGDLDPLRVVETVEHGALPLQVMPDGPARLLASELPAALAGLVVPSSELEQLDLSPAGVTTRLDPAAELLLRGSAERDLLAGAYG